MTTRSLVTSRAPHFVRFLNPITKSLVHLGFRMGPASMILLTVYGRKTGQPHTTPVSLFEAAGRRYLFSTFGEVSWVRNLRSRKDVVISYGRYTEKFAAVELSPEAAAPIVRDAFAPYLASFFMRPMLQSWYGVKRDTSLDDFITVARSHPVFELRDS